VAGVVRDGPDGHVNLKVLEAPRTGALVTVANDTDPVTGSRLSIFRLEVGGVGAGASLLMIRSTANSPVQSPRRDKDQRSDKFHVLRPELQYPDEGRDGRSTESAAPPPRIIDIHGSRRQGPLAVTQSFRIPPVRTNCEQPLRHGGVNKTREIRSIHPVRPRTTSKQTARFVCPLYPKKIDFLRP